MKKMILLWLLLAVGIALLCSGCSSLENKAFATGSTVGAMKLETTGSVSSGTVFPNLLLGDAVTTVATAPALKEEDSTQVVFVRTFRRSFFGTLFGLDVGSESISYIGAPGETAADTNARFEAFAKITNPAKSTAASTATTEAAK